MIHTISPGRASHIMLSALRDVITMHKLEHGGRVDIPMESAKSNGPMLAKHPLRLSPVKLHRIVNESKGLIPDDGFGGRIGPEGYPTGASFHYTAALNRLIRGGLVHRRFRWVDSEGGQLIPDYTITNLGITALDHLESNAYYILWRD